MKRICTTLLLICCCILAVAAAPSDLQKKLEQLKGISGIEKLETELYPEKYLLRIEQQRRV